MIDSNESLSIFQNFPHISSKYEHDEKNTWYFEKPSIKSIHKDPPRRDSLLKINRAPIY